MSNTVGEIPLDIPMYVRHLAVEIDSFAAVLAHGQWDQKVPMSSTWVLADLTRHLGSVHRWAASIVRSGVRQPLPAPPSRDVDLLSWFIEGGEELIDILSNADPDADCWSFGIEKRASFWFRRQVHETLVHRHDAQAATGTPDITDGILAADGVDEVLTVMLPRAAERFGQPPNLRAPVALLSVDTGHRWVLEKPEDEMKPTKTTLNSPIDATATWAGTSGNLLLSLWGRRDPVSVLSSSGNSSIANDLWTGRLVP